jgi:hypothetical protein
MISKKTWTKAYFLYLESHFRKKQDPNPDPNQNLRDPRIRIRIKTLVFDRYSTYLTLPKEREAKNGSMKITSNDPRW